VNKQERSPAGQGEAVKNISAEVKTSSKSEDDEGARAKMKTVRIVGTIVFSALPGESTDPDGAAAALRRAGFEVTLMPEKFRALLDEPEDYFMEASIEGFEDDNLAIWHEIEAIVDQYGAICDRCGPVPSDWVPLEDVFPEIKKEVGRQELH
jgi:hypothetical protein